MAYHAAYPRRAYTGGHRMYAPQLYRQGLHVRTPMSRVSAPMLSSSSSLYRRRRKQFPSTQEAAAFIRQKKTQRGASLAMLEVDASFHTRIRETEDETSDQEYDGKGGEGDNTAGGEYIETNPYRSLLVSLCMVLQTLPMDMQCTITRHALSQIPHGDQFASCEDHHDNDHTVLSWTPTMLGYVVAAALALPTSPQSGPRKASSPLVHRHARCRPHTGQYESAVTTWRRVIHEFAAHVEGPVNTTPTNATNATDATNTTHDIDVNDGIDEMGAVVDGRQDPSKDIILYTHMLEQLLGIKSIVLRQSEEDDRIFALDYTPNHGQEFVPACYILLTQRHRDSVVFPAYHKGRAWFPLQAVPRKVKHLASVCLRNESCWYQKGMGAPPEEG